MALRHVIGLDHVVIAVRDLDAAAGAWRALGFTVSPRGTHSAHMGSGNYTMMLGEDYMELLGVLVPTDHNAGLRAFLEKREGLDRAAFTATDADAGAEEVRARGLAATGPVAFGRSRCRAAARRRRASGSSNGRRRNGRPALESSPAST